MADKSKIEDLTDADLDDVQGGFQKAEVTAQIRGSRVKQAGHEGMVLSSETEEPYLRAKNESGKRIVLSSEGENPY